MHKLDVEEWFVRVVQAMYTNARSRGRVNGTLSEEFGVKIGVHQRPVIGPYCSLWYLKHCRLGSDQVVYMNYYMLMILH